jgi:hypothetical protein
MRGVFNLVFLGTIAYIYLCISIISELELIHETNLHNLSVNRWIKQP